MSIEPGPPGFELLSSSVAVCPRFVVINRLPESLQLRAEVLPARGDRRRAACRRAAARGAGGRLAHRRVLLRGARAEGSAEAVSQPRPGQDAQAQSLIKGETATTARSQHWIPQKHKNLSKAQTRARNRTTAPHPFRMKSSCLQNDLFFFLDFSSRTNKQRQAVMPCTPPNPTTPAPTLPPNHQWRRPGKGIEARANDSLIPPLRNFAHDRSPFCGCPSTSRKSCASTR